MTLIFRKPLPNVEHPETFNHIMMDWLKAKATARQ